MSSIDQSGTFTLGDRTVKRLGYGAMQLAGPGVFGPPKDHNAALAVLREAVASGVNHIDTSDYYGPHVTNQLIREALAPYPTISSSSPRSAPGAAATAPGCRPISPEELDPGGARQSAAISGSTCWTSSISGSCSARMDPAEGLDRGAAHRAGRAAAAGSGAPHRAEQRHVGADRASAGGSPRSSACRTSTIWRIGTTMP